MIHPLPPIPLRAPRPPGASDFDPIAWAEYENIRHHHARWSSSQSEEAYPPYKPVWSVAPLPSAQRPESADLGAQREALQAVRDVLQALLDEARALRMDDRLARVEADVAAALVGGSSQRRNAAGQSRTYVVRRPGQPDQTITDLHVLARALDLVPTTVQTRLSIGRGEFTMRRNGQLWSVRRLYE